MMNVDDKRLISLYETIQQEELLDEGLRNTLIIGVAALLLGMSAPKIANKLSVKLDDLQAARTNPEIVAVVKQQLSTEEGRKRVQSMLDEIEQRQSLEDQQRGMIGLGPDETRWGSPEDLAGVSLHKSIAQAEKEMR